MNSNNHKSVLPITLMCYKHYIEQNLKKIKSKTGQNPYAKHEHTISLKVPHLQNNNLLDSYFQSPSQKSLQILPNTDKPPRGDNVILLNKIIELQEELIRVSQEKSQIQQDYSVVLQKENRLRSDEDQTQDGIYHENQKMKIQIEQLKFDNEKLLQSNEQMTIKFNQLSHGNKHFLDSIDDNFEIKNRLGTCQLSQISYQPTSYMSELNDLKKYLKVEDTQVALSNALSQLVKLNEKFEQKEQTEWLEQNKNEENKEEKVENEKEKQEIEIKRLKDIITKYEEQMIQYKKKLEKTRLHYEKRIRELTNQFITIKSSDFEVIKKDLENFKEQEQEQEQKQEQEQQ